MGWVNQRDVNSPFLLEPWLSGHISWSARRLFLGLRRKGLVGGGGGGLYYRSPFNTPITAVDYDPNTLKKKEKKKEKKKRGG